MTLELYQSRIFELPEIIGGFDEFNWTHQDFVRAHKFYMSIKTIPEDISIRSFELVDLLLTDGKFRLPFEHTIIEIDVDTAHIALLCRELKVNETHIRSFDLDEHTTRLLEVSPLLIRKINPYLFPFVISLDGQEPGKYHHVTNRDDDVGTVPENMIWKIICIIGLLHLDAFNVIEVEPPATIQRKRMASHKPPLFKFSILKIDLEKTRVLTKNFGGMHKSPALHWRRGHYRKLPTMMTFVKPHLVGNIRNGLNDRAYQLMGLDK